MSKEALINSSEAPPPSYTDAVLPPRPKDTLPSYNNVMGLSQLKKNIQEAKQESDNPAISFYKICCICIGFWLCTILITLLIGALHISLIVVGAVHKDDCNLDDRIPIWMIVCGSVSIAIGLVDCFKTRVCSSDKYTREDRPSDAYGREDNSSLLNSCANLCANIIESLLGLFLFIWWIIGSVWVLGKYDDWDDAGRPDCDDYSPSEGTPYDNCCHEGTFLLAFIFIIFVWCLMFLSICCACTCICILVCFSIKGTSN
ncbi:transmembrane protein 272-like [Dysidea avara]|uniref:transmembrane protein 272-like n=1 Tax=Dysidea avara TaxID=196820 RepID=UPI00331DE4E0